MSQDQNRIKEKVKEALSELERESFKNDVLNELREASKKRKPGFLQHPAILLFLGFALTTGGGTWLTYYWQGKDQEKQRKQLAHQHAIQQKYEVAEQVNKAVADAYTGTHVALTLLSSPRTKKNEKEAREREAYWTQANRNWIPTSLMLQQKLSINFKSQKALSLFQKIIDDMEDLIVELNEKLKASKTPGATPYTQQEIIEKGKITNEIRNELSQLLTLLIAEAHQEEVGG